MKDSEVQTFGDLSDPKVHKKIEQLITEESETTYNINHPESSENNHSEMQSRASSPEGYMMAYKMSNQKLHFDPGVYDHFKGIETAKQWQTKKKIIPKNHRKNVKPLEKNLSSITEDNLSGREDNRYMISQVSESDDESLRREAVRQSSFVEKHLHPPLIFEASTQTDSVIQDKKKKVRISPEKCKKTKTPIKRITNIDLTDQAPSKYLEKYLSSRKKKTKSLPAITEPLFSPIRPRPVSGSSSSRSSRSSSQNSSSDVLKKHKKSKGNYSNIPTRINASDASSHYDDNQMTEFQINPYMSASWYMTYDYISPASYGSGMESLERVNPQTSHNPYMGPILNNGNKITLEKSVYRNPYYNSTSSLISRTNPKLSKNYTDIGHDRPWH